MDAGRCSVIYLDRRSENTGLVKRDDLKTKASSGPTDNSNAESEQDGAVTETNLQAILSTFNEVYVCADGQTCLKRLAQLEESGMHAPTLLLIEIPDADDHPAAASSATPVITQNGLSVEKNEPVDLYGVDMLSHICSSIQQRSMSRLIVPVAVTVNSEAARAALEEEPSLWALSKCSPDIVRGVKYLDIGAVDVLTSPISADRIHGLTVHAYRVFKEQAKEDTSSVLTKRNRKLSWIGIDEERPFAYLREAMVSGLMIGICNPETVNDSFDAGDLRLEEGRKEIVEAAVGEWSFSAHDFTSDELVHAARVMLLHALNTPELTHWLIPEDELTIFIMACRRAYNDFVLYHNFRHVVDVLQAIFYFLLRIGILPPYRVEGNPAAKPSNAIAAVLQPFDALTLLVSALGHDVGHPGVNNAFLVALNAPLAQLYNDRSVLEAFHCAAYSQILRRYWPKTFEDMAMRKLMITSILATDMGLHFKYMKEMGSLQEKIAAAQSTADGWSPKVTDENRDLVCGLLIKCADISNVARKYACAAQWARVLTDEFANQGAMEKELNLPTCLFGGPPDPNDFLKLAESQLGFMNIFARPLFEGVAGVLPEMRFTLAELSTNKAIWQERIEAENSRKMSFARGPLSPVSRSTTTASETDSIDQREQMSPIPAEMESSKYSIENSQDRSRSMHSMVQQAGTPQLDPLEEAPDMLTPQPDARSPAIDADARSQSSIYSGKMGSRQGSIDPALATTILVHSRTSAAAQEMLDISAPSSPSKSVISTSHQGLSIPSSRSQGTTYTDMTSRPSTSASSVDERPQSQPQIVVDGQPLKGENKSEEYIPRKTEKDSTFEARRLQTQSVYGPDVMAARAASNTSPSKDSITSQITAGSNDGQTRRDLRSSRSQSRLGTLKFWKKKLEAGQ